MIVTAKEYAALMEVSPAIITKRLQKQAGNKFPFELPQAFSVVKHGNQWRIELGDDCPFDSVAAQIDFRQRKKNKSK